MMEDTFSLIKLAQSGDGVAKERLVRENTGLIWSIARKFFGRGQDADDLFQIGAMGLIKAIERFDPSMQVQFSTYAVPMIVGEIKRFLRDDGIIKVSRSLKETAARAAVVSRDLLRELGREPTTGELSARMNLPVEELVMALDANMPPESLNYEMTEDGGTTLQDRVDRGVNLEVDALNKVALQSALSRFKSRDRQIIMLRYFSCKTQSQIASMLGISQVQVSRIEKKVLNELKTLLSEAL